MKYYFKIHTGDRYNAGTDSDITVVLYGEKGQTEARSLRSCASGKPFQRNQTDLIAVDFSFDAGLINRISLEKDAQLYLLNGWLCDYIMVSKQPFDNAQSQCSVFNINDWLIAPGSSGTYDVSKGYPYTVNKPSIKIDPFSNGTIALPKGATLDKTVSSGLTIGVDRSSVRTTDVSTGLDITLSEEAIMAVFNRHINQSITDTTNISLNKTEEYSDSINIGPYDDDKVYEVLWNKMIYCFDIIMGELHFTFEVPYQESFAGLRDTDSGKIIKAFYLRNLRKEPISLFRSIGIALTRKCNAACSMCCFECSMEKEETLSREEVYGIIEQAEDIPGISRIGFSGGEAMLYPDLLFDGLARAKEAGMLTSLTTNGFWGKDSTECRRVLNALHSVGLDSLTVSIDNYHLEYVPLEAAVNIVRSSREIGVPLTLAIGDSLEGRRASDILQALGPDAYSVNLILYPFMPVGRGSAFSSEQIHTIPYSPGWKCRNNRQLAVLYDGNVYPCCSQAVYGSGLSMGNIRERSLSDIVKDYSGKGIFSTLQRKGLDWFVQIARSDFGMKVADSYHSPCHLCNQLFTDPAFVNGIAGYVEQEYNQTIYDFLEM